MTKSDRTLTQAGLDKGSQLVEVGTVLILVRGGILFQRVPIGIAMVPVAFNQDVKAIKVTGKIDPWFLLYWLIGHEKELLKLVSFTGIGAGKFDLKQLQSLSICLPPISEQVRIAKIVKKIDDKIYLNRQTNETLDQIAQAFINGDSLLARITPCLENGKSAYVDFLEEGQVGWGSTEYIVMRSKDPFPLEMSYFILRHEAFRNYAIQSMNGSSGRQRTDAKT